jgi:hypothetical protein
MTLFTSARQRLHQGASLPAVGARGTSLGALRGMFARHWVLRLAGFFLLLALIAQSLHQALNAGLRRVRTSQFGAFNRVMSGDVNAEILINGSSRALAHYDPRIIRKITGRTAYNLGRDASQTDMQVAILKAYLNHNEKPRILVQNLDLFSFLVTHKGEVYEPGFYLPYLYEDALYNALRQIDPAAWRWRNIPLYGYVVEDMRFTWVTGLKGIFGFSPREDYFLGFNPRSAVWSGEFERFKAKHPDGVRTATEPAGVAAMDELLGVCARGGIQVVLVYSPEYSGMQALETDRPKIMGMFRALSERCKVPLWDYSDSAFCQQKQLFRNSQHLNKDGAEAFSADLAARLAKSCFPAESHLVETDRSANPGFRP